MRVLQQSLRRVEFNDLSLVEYDDFIAVDDRGQLVRNRYDSAVLKRFLDGLLDDFFILIVDVGCGLVDDDDGGVPENGSGNGDELLLALA